jgi:hypothetical protein
MSLLTIQPSTIDNMLVENVPDNNLGAGAAISIYSSSAANRRIIIQFDFSALPAGSSITAATLELYYGTYITNDPVGRLLWANELTETGWTETKSTWNAAYDADLDGVNDAGDIFWATPGGDFITTDRASCVVPAAFGWLSWNVLALVTHFQGNHNKIANFLIHDGTEGSATQYVVYCFSREYTTDTTLCPKLVITYSSGTNLVVQDGTQGQAVNNEVLTQVHNIAVASGIQAQTVENIVLTQAHVLIPANGLQGQAVGNVVLTQVHALAVAGGVQAQAADNAVLTQAHNLAVADGAQGQSVGNVLLTQVHTLAVASGIQAQEVDAPALTQVHILSVSGGSQAQTVGNVALTQAHNLAVASGLQDQTVDNILLDLATFLTVADGTQGQSVGNVILAQIHNLAVFGGVQAQTAEDVILTQDHNLAVAGGAQAQAVGNVVLTTTAPPTSPIKVLLVSGNMIIQVG